MKPDYVIEDETPTTFAELKPPGYFSKVLGYFVEVRLADNAPAPPVDLRAPGLGSHVHGKH